MSKHILLLFTSFLFIQNIYSQTLEEKISKDLLNALVALKAGNHYESITFLDKCQDQLGEQIVPRVEELYIENLSALNNPILLAEHIEKYLNISKSNRKSYDDVLGINKNNKRALLRIHNEFKIASDYFFEKSKTWNDSPLVLLSKNKNHYAINYLGECVFSIIEKKVNKKIMFNDGFACIGSSIYNKKGEIVFADKYDELEKPYGNNFREGVLQIKKDGKYGVLDTLGNYLVPPKYNEKIKYFVNGIVVKKGNKYGVLDWSNKELIPFIYDEIIIDFIYERKGGQFKVKQNDLWGLVDNSNNILLPIEYDDISFLNDNDIVKIKKNNAYGFANSKGEVIVPIIYNKGEADDYNLNYHSFFTHSVVLKLKNKYGVIDKNNKEIIDFAYDSIRQNINSSSELVYTVQKDQKWGVISGSGKVILPLEYDNVYLSWHNYVTVFKDNKVGLFDLDGVLIFPLKYDSIVVHYINRAENLIETIRGEDKSFYYKNKEVFNTKNRYQATVTSLPSDKESVLEKVGSHEVTFLRRGILAINSNGNLNIFSHEGSLIFSKEYDISSYYIEDKKSLYYFDNIDPYNLRKNLIPLKNIQQKIAFGNLLTGEIITDFEYEEINFGDLGFGIKVYKKGSKFGVLNYNLDEIIPFEYDDIQSIENSSDHVFVKKEGKYGVFNIFGRKVIPIIYESIQFLSDDFIKVEHENKYGYLNLENEKVIPITYDDLEVYSDGVIKAKLGKTGLIDGHNKVIEPFIYEEIEFGINNIVRLKLKGEWLVKQINLFIK